MSTGTYRIHVRPMRPDATWLERKLRALRLWLARRRLAQYEHEFVVAAAMRLVARKHVEALEASIAPAPNREQK